jgi:glutaredoxin 3
MVKVVGMPAEVKVYTTKVCPYCIRAKALLAKRGIAYEEVDVSADPSTRDWLIKATGGRKTVPQIFIAGEPIGGSDELVELDRAGELVKKVFGAEATA